MQELEEVPELDTPSDEAMEVASETWKRAEEALAGHLATGETILLTVGALERMALQFFDRCELVLTDRSLIILKPSWPWGYRFERSLARADCSVFKHKQRMDGSALLVIRCAGEDLGFFIPRRSRDAGIAILEALR